MKKKLKIGRVKTDQYKRSLLITCEVEIREKEDNKKELSICGNVWNTKHTDIETGGQISDTIAAYIAEGRFIPIMPIDTVKKILEIWDRWHLNALRAGCEHQRAEHWEAIKLDDSKPLTMDNMAVWKRPGENPKGLLTKPCPVCGYKYGTSWLYEPLPEEVISFINSL
ncbi:Uncharacterised protein [uncultured archaeon]|nr:Uncharacterised protein [uncultured archaeon]